MSETLQSRGTSPRARSQRRAQLRFRQLLAFGLVPSLTALACGGADQEPMLRWTQPEAGTASGGSGGRADEHGGRVPAESGGTAPGASGGTVASASGGAEQGGSTPIEFGGIGGQADTAFRCLEQALPTTAAAKLTIGGLANSLAPTGATTVLSGVSVDAFVGDEPGVAAASTSSASDGSYSLELSTAGKPIEWYLHGTHAGYLDAYVFGPMPLASNGSPVTMLLVSPSTVALTSFVTHVAQLNSMGQLGVAVYDCDGKPVAGATVRAEPQGSIFYVRSGTLDTAASNTDASGSAFIFNVPPGEVTVSAEVNGIELRSHVVRCFANAVTETGIVP